jgi:hypothetical protein
MKPISTRRGRGRSRRAARAGFSTAILLAATGPALAQADAHVHAGAPAPASTSLYRTMAPLQDYLMASESEEIALARSAAPASISGDADILVLSADGHHRAVAGKNGWTCMVQRSWNDALDKPDFWNAKIRVPICLNAAASRSVLPVYLERTKWVLAGRPLAQIVEETRAQPAPAPEPGSFAIMMSKQGYLADGIGPAGPHVMVYLNVPASAWAAGLPGSPVGMATPGYKGSDTIFYLGARKWSDGTTP